MELIWEPGHGCEKNYCRQESNLSTMKRSFVDTAFAVGLDSPPRSDMRLTHLDATEPIPWMEM